MMHNLCSDLQETAQDMWVYLCQNEPKLPHTTYLRRADRFQITIGQCQYDWLAIELSWSFVSAPVKVDNNTWKLNIEITFGTRLAPQYHLNECFGFSEEDLKSHLQNPPPPSEAPFQWAPLRPAAFRPKQYNITLSRGRFICPWSLTIKRPYPIFQSGYKRFSPDRYYNQITFDNSPYPPREEFAHEYRESRGCGVHEHNLDRNLYWEMKTFVRDGIEKKDETWAEMLDPGWWLSSTRGKWGGSE
jgi:hypothetical protein